MASTGKHQWYVGEDGCIPTDEPVCNVTYHSALNSLIVTTEEPAVKIFDVTSGSVLQKSDLSAEKGEHIKTMYLPDKNRMVFSDSTSLGVRKDLQGVLLIDTALQTPLSSADKNVRLELPLAEATQLFKSIASADLPCGEAVDIVSKELQQQIDLVQETTKGNHKTAKWATVCLNVPYHALMSVSSTLVAEMRRINVHSPGLSIASSVSDRLGYLLPSNSAENSGGTVDRSLMYSEAARRDTFTKWPHMNYKWALPDPMAQAGFYHQPNMSGDDRALCFTCNVCLVCWEPTDEPWSEHERHSPSCPFVKGEHTQNVPLSVTFATQPALTHSVSGQTGGSERIACVSTTASEDYVATSTKHGSIVVWNLRHKMKRHSQFVLDPTEPVVAMKTGLQVIRQADGHADDVQTDKHSVMQDSLEPQPTQGAESNSVGGDEPDAVSVSVGCSATFDVGEDETLAKSESKTDMAPMDKTDNTEDEPPFIRPNEDVVVSSLCIVEKLEQESNENSCPRKPETGKKDRPSKIKRRPIQPSVICGVSLRCPKVRSNCDDDGSDNIQTNVQLMNKVNESVSGETSPQIITDSENMPLQCSNGDILDATTSFIPYLLVVSVKEEVKKVSKQASMDSLKPSTSSSNILPNLTGMSMNQPDWSLLDQLFDSDNDVATVKVTVGPSTLSTSSPTEGISKQDEICETTNSLNQPNADSAIKRFSSQKSGSVLQCVEFPSNLRSEFLEVTSITPTIDKSHIVVVLSPKSQCSHKSSLNSLTLEQSSHSKSESSDPSIEVIDVECSSSDSALKLTDSSEGGSVSEANTNTNTAPAKSDSDFSPTNGCILIYKFNYSCDNNQAKIDETPVCVKYLNDSEVGVQTIYILPAEITDAIEEDEILASNEDIFVSTPFAASVSTQQEKGQGLYGQLVAVYTSGRMDILNTADLSVLASISKPAGDKFVDVTYCSGIDRLCACSSQGRLYFYQLSEDCPEQSDSMMEGDLTPTGEAEAGFPDNSHTEDGEHLPKTSASDLLARQSITFESLSSLYTLTQFENLMPRFTATVPPCWSEMQQEQQQRRHPQHLQHQGEATQHTRTWKLQPDSNTWDEHLFEIVLPRACCVGHVDVKFSINGLCPITPDIQMTLLKQNINAIGRHSQPDATSTPVDTKINFNIAPPPGKSNGACSTDLDHPSISAMMNNVQDPQFLDKHNAEILCGPVSIADCLDMSATGGLVSLTSPQLLMSKPRSLLLHVKGFPSKQSEEKTDKSKDVRKKRAATSGPEKKSIKHLFNSYAAGSGTKAKLENLKGCDWITEVSITIRKTKRTCIAKERLQRNCMIDVTSFHERLLSTVVFDEGYLLAGVSPDHIQNLCLDILAWVTNIQMNDPDSRCMSRCVLTSIQPRLKSLIQACFLQGSRSTAHKCARLLTLCIQYSKCSIDADLATGFSLALLEALLSCLPQLLCTYSAGGLKWFFTILNRVKCMDMSSTATTTSELLSVIAKHFHERALPYHAVLKARYGLNGHPFESDQFDMELPQAVKQIIPGSQSFSPYTSTVTTGTGSSSVQGTSATEPHGPQADVDFYELFNGSMEKSSKSVTEHARNHILGMLEVEPLHFTCHSTSDGTKMERLDNVNNSTGGSSVINPFGGPGNTGTNTMSGTINFGESVPTTAFSGTHLSTLPYTLPPSMAAPKPVPEQKAHHQSMKHKIMHIKQMLHEVNKNILPSSQASAATGSSELMPSTPKTTPQVMTPPLTPPNEAWQQMLLAGEKSDTPKALGQTRQALGTVQTSHAMLQAPPPQVLVIERIYSGARRFVILDFGKPVLLTDVIIPLCGDLASLSIDVWVKGEETDGQRLIVASDIGVRSLVMNNIMPPPVCRFLKITTIGRYGSGTTRSKIPIGAFYGHSYILPWEWSHRHDTSHSPTAAPAQMDFPSQSQLLNHLGSFVSLLEDIQCRYSLAKARLGFLLQHVETPQFANHHTQYYLKKTKNNEEDNAILQAYNDCLQLQLQQNLATRAIDRIQSAIGLRVPSTQYPDSIGLLLRQASTDKLRCILESLLETMISLTVTPGGPSLTPLSLTPSSLYMALDPAHCRAVFTHLTLHGTPRLQLLTGMVLVRVCGSQPWFGEFLGNVIQEYFYSETSQVFSQDRVFVLLTAMGQRSLQGPCAVNVMESLLTMLARVLSPIHNQASGVISPSGHLDLTLIGWILLFMCRNLDNTVATNGNGDEQGAAGGSKKPSGTNLSNRWNFIGANGNVKSQINKSQSLRTYRRSLHKRLLHHKQKLMAMDQMKKTYLAQEQTASAGTNKLQGKQFWKELTQFASKHLKDIIQIRKTDAEMLRKLPRDQRAAAEERVADSMGEYEQDSVLVLPKDTCLPVVHGLMALLLGMDFTCNVDLFLITCKVLARLCIATRPAITLTEAMNQGQLERLIMLAANLEFNHGNISWGGPWAGHALTCLLQDILDGERAFPVGQMEGLTDDEMSSQVTDDSLQYEMDLSNVEGAAADIGPDHSGTDSLASSTLESQNTTDMQDSSTLDPETGTSQGKEEASGGEKESSQYVDMLFDYYDEDDANDKFQSYLMGKENTFPTPIITTESEIDENKYKPVKPSHTMKAFHSKFGGQIGGASGSGGYFPYHTKMSTPLEPTPMPTATPSAISAAPSSIAPGQGLSTALDARLELGLETQSELKLRMMLSLQSDALQNAFSSPLPMLPIDIAGSNPPSRSSPTDGELLENSTVQCTSSEMLSSAYDHLFSQLVMQRVNMDALLQLWLILNGESYTDSSDRQSQFDASRCPTIRLSVTSVTNLLACVAMTPSLPVRTWVLVFQSLTLLANLRIGAEEQRSMVVAMMADPNLVAIITKFLSGTSLSAPASSYDANSQVGPSAVKSFHLFLQRLRVCICGEDNIHNLKEIMLKLVYSLTAERGAFHSSLGPLDAQCKFLDFILELPYDQVDINNAISVIESVSSLVHRHILCQERVYCRSTSDNGVNARSCFGGMFSSLIRGGDSGTRNGDSSKDSLICSLLKLVNKLLQVHFPARFGRRVSLSSVAESHSDTGSSVGLSESVSDAAKLSQGLMSSSPRGQALATSSPRAQSIVSSSSSLIGQSDEEKVEAGASGESMDSSGHPQTDEQKTESAQQSQDHSRTSLDNAGINLPDIILERQGIMCNFIQALSYCNSSTMAMILGSSGMPMNMQESFTGGDPQSVGDGIYQILSTLSRQCSNCRSLMEALFLYLSSGFMPPGSQSLCRLSEPLLWFMLKVLDSPKMLKMFLDKGGVEVVCRNFVNCNSRIISTTPSLVSTIMQNMNGQAHTDKRKKWEAESPEGIQNFAPLGSIVSCSPTASPAEVLIVSTPQHRRARSAPWSYHFYPDEAWVDLKVTLPFAILLKEVQIQPHSPALSTCPAFVSLEASQDGVTMFPLCAPMNTSSLVYIKLQLQRPEVVTSVTIRLHRARDSMTIGLSQILLMGFSAFGEVGYKTNNLFLPTEDFVSRSSVGWIRLLHHCLVSSGDLQSSVAECASPTQGLLTTCTALLVSPVSSVYAPTIEAVLMKLGLHSGETGLALIDNLLRSGTGSDHDLSSHYLGKMSGVANESTVEILYQLGTVQDTWTADRLKAMLQWLGDSARVALQKKATFSDDGFRQMPHDMSCVSLPGPAPLHVHCIAVVLWHSCENRVDYNLGSLITKDLVSSLYEWSTVLERDSFLKRAVDYVLCAVCHISPDSFTRIMEWMGIIITPEYGLTASISDDCKEPSHYHDLTDDTKEEISARGLSSESEQSMVDSEAQPVVILQDFKHMCLDETHLRTLAVACQSNLATRQLLESGFPAVLAQGLFEFCNRVISNFADSWSQPEAISDSCKSLNGTAGDNTNMNNTHNSLTVSADMVEAVLNFFSEISCRPAMKDWLGGADGNIFWPVLLTMLCNTPLHSPIAALAQKYELISAEERSAIETASVTFFRSVIASHVQNQMLFAKVLFDVIKEQGASNKTVGVGVCSLSGFTRRLFLQVLLEDETILVAFRATPEPYTIHKPAHQVALSHPQFGVGHRSRTLRVNLHSTVGELLNKVSDTPSIAAQLLDVHNGKKSDESKESGSTCQIGLDLVDVIENMAVKMDTSDKTTADTATTSTTSSTGVSTAQAGGAKSLLSSRPPTRRGRNLDPLNKQLQIPVLSVNHHLLSNRSLPSDLGLSQLLQVLQQQGLPQGHDVLEFNMLFQNKKHEEPAEPVDDVAEIPPEVLLASPMFPTPLQIFASVGGLALLAEHLPLLYPEISRPIASPGQSGETTPNNATNGGDTANDWVTVDNYPEDFYMLYEPMSPAPQTSRGHHLGNLTIPPHSLIAFCLFLRLPGYAEVLLKERKKAQCLLRLMLGVTDDGGGGQILTSPIASTLPTLPFIVLKSLFDTTPLSTDDGVLLRRMCLDNGALHLILACMSVLSHHSPRVSVPGIQQEAYTMLLGAMQTPPAPVAPPPVTTTNEKSQQYWAKGTGFGTGSTTSSWDAEQALMRQKSEEEHVTCLLQVLASYINPGGRVPADFTSAEYEPPMEQTLLPDVVPEMLVQSCLVPALSSYLRNDSVLDMARHVPLYRALLLLLRGISVCPSLVQLLLPLDIGGEGSAAVGELLEKMRACVDTYASRLKSNKGKITGTKEEEEENEGLAMLIPDIQDTATIVHTAVDRLKLHQGPCDQEVAGSAEASSVSQDDVNQVYLNEMQKLQFDQYEMVEEEGSTIKFQVRHHYEANVKAAGEIKNPTRIRRLAQEAVTLSTSLPLSVSSSVFVRCDEERLDIMKVLITGPEDTPYANGCFEFDVYFPQDYPNAPPNINLETTGNHAVRFNPNLYNDGKVCLSVLNTWHGRPEEKWSAQTSSFLQVLVSIQSLILVCEPYFNEPGYERSRGTAAGTASSREYDANIRQATVKWAILEQIKNPPPCFKEVVQKHFWLKRHKILKQCEGWIEELETFSTDKRTGRTISHSTLALKKHYNQLREEFSKMKAPEGLENVGKGEINPKEKQYSTDQAGSSGNKDLPQIVPADSNANNVIPAENATMPIPGTEMMDSTMASMWLAKC